jgi:hypothetical protein
VVSVIRDRNRATGFTTHQLTDEIDWAGRPGVLVVRPDNLGDVLRCEPALRALRRAAPHARLDLLASPHRQHVSGTLWLARCRPVYPDS